MPRTPVYLVAMPIGDHPEDISVAAIRLLPTLTHLFVEPDEVGVARLRKLRLITERHQVYPVDTAQDRALELVAAGEPIAILASSGIPCFVDPGHALVGALLDHHLDRCELIPIGMSSALDAALVVAGMNIQQFTFVGHFPEYHRFHADLVALTLPLIAFVRGSAIRRWAALIQDEVPKFARHVVLRNVRKRDGARLWVLRKYSPLPDDLVDDPTADFVAVVAVKPNRPGS